MRCQIPLLAVVLSLSRFAALSVADEPAPEIPQEWRVELRTEASVFETSSRHLPNVTIRLKSDGEFSEYAGTRTKMKLASQGKLTPPEALTGLHLLWSVLDDASVFGEISDDADRVHVTLETKNWTWKRHWAAHSTDLEKTLQKIDSRLETFVSLIHREEIDPAAIRTKHFTAAELRSRWTEEGKKLSLWNPGAGTFRWYGSASGIRLNTRELRGPDIGGASGPGNIIDLLADLRERCTNREATGKASIFLALESGGTNIEIRGLKDFSEAGRRIERLVELAQGKGLCISHNFCISF